MKEVDSNPHRWLGVVQDFTEEVAADVMETARELASEVKPEDVTWTAPISWSDFSGWGVTLYGWAKKVVSWDGIYYWWVAMKIVEKTTECDY